MIFFFLFQGGINSTKETIMLYNKYDLVKITMALSKGKNLMV